MKVELTADQCTAIADYIELTLIDQIRTDTDIDSFEWLQIMVEAQRVLKKAGEADEKIINTF